MPKTILLADDSVTIQKVVGITFAGEDIELVTVDNGDDALARARGVRPDLILADVTMPGLNGYELCRAIQRDPELSGTPVLLLTGTFETFDGRRAREAGASGHITKPFEAQALVAQVNSLLGRQPRGSKRAPAKPSGKAPADKAAEAMEDLKLGDQAEAQDPLLGMSAAEISLEDLGRNPPVPAQDKSLTRDSPGAGPSRGSGYPREPAGLDFDLGALDAVEDFGPLTPGAGDGGDPFAKTTLFQPQPKRPAGPALGGNQPQEADELSPPEMPWVEPSEADPLEEPGFDLPEADPLFELPSPRPPARAEAPVEIRGWGPDPLEETPFRGAKGAAPQTSGSKVGGRKDLQGGPSAAQPTSPARARRSEPPPEPSDLMSADLAREALEKVAWEAFGTLSEQVVREIVRKVEAIAWEAIPAVAERLVRAEIARLKEEEPAE
jgi:CheY-like chemotaxis protein